jgi:hypothetical protein
MLNDHSRDELRRALAEADAAQREAMPRFREALKRFFAPDSRDVDALDRQARAMLLGVPVPARRAFLRSSGLAVVGAAALAACSDDDGGATGETGTTPVPDAGTGDEPAGPTAGDVDLAIAAIQIENTAIAAYNAVTATRAADLQAAGAADAAVLFRDHHLEHAGALNGLLNDNGMNAIPEDEYFGGITLPSADDIATLPIADIAAFARGLENQAAQTYITAVPRLSLPGLRQTLMSIGSIEAKHVAAYDMLLGGGPAGYATTAQLIVGGNYPTDESFLNA